MSQHRIFYLATVCCLGLLLAIANPASTDDRVKRNNEATQIAKAWFTSFLSGETAVTTALSGVPFSFDKEQVVKSLPELKALYDEIVSTKGKRDLRPTSVTIKSSSPQTVEVLFMIENESIVVSVKPGQTLRVMGFSD